MVIAVYLLSFLLAVALLWFVRSRPWYLHILAIAAAIGLGFVQTPDAWKGIALDLTFGGIITFLLVWGIGGLVTIRAHRGHRERHA